MHVEVRVVGIGGFSDGAYRIVRSGSTAPAEAWSSQSSLAPIIVEASLKPSEPQAVGAPGAPIVPGAPRERRLRAFKVISEIRRKLLETYGPTDYDSAEEIRRWRDARK